MRDYLKLWEVWEVLYDTNLPTEETEEIMDKMRKSAITCLCAARSSSECCCGAWDDYSEEDG